MRPRIASEIMKRFSPSRPTVIFAGAGNNGADALIVARLLIEAGFRPHVLLFNFNGNSLSRDCLMCYRELLAVGIPFEMTEIRDRAEIPLLTPDHLVIDGLFGSGLRDPLSGGFTMLVRNISESGATVVSIDVPSGMFGDWNARIISRNVVHADLTLAIQFPRLAFFLADNAPLTGEWKVLDIGLSRKAIEETQTKFHYVEREDVRAVLKPRPPFSSKADYGQAILFAGCYGMMGAAVMAAKGALRSGVGKLTVHAPRFGFAVMQSQVPEALYSPDKDDIVISDMTPRFTYNAVGVGPGIGTNDATRGAFETLVKTMKRPMVIDADGLNMIARNQQLLDHLPPGSILTPMPASLTACSGPRARPRPVCSRPSRCRANINASSCSRGTIPPRCAPTARYSSTRQAPPPWPRPEAATCSPASSPRCWLRATSPRWRRWSGSTYTVWQARSPPRHTANTA